MNTEEFAAAVGLKPSTVRQWIWRRKVEYVRIGRSIRFRPETVAKIIREGTVPARAETRKEQAQDGSQAAHD